MLTPKKERFVTEYLIDSNATQAAIRAGYSKKTAKVQASKLLTKLDVKEALDKAREEYAKRLDVKAEATLRKLMRGQEFDVRKLYKLDDDGKHVLKQPWELCDDAAAAVVGIDYKDGQMVYKIIDVKGCAKLVGDYLKLFSDSRPESETGQLNELKEIIKQSASGL